MTSDYRTGVITSRPLQGTDMVSAWKYECISDGDNSHVKITSVT